jgi:hypothetical protein
MSNVCFAVVFKGKVSYYVTHYSVIKDLLKSDKYISIDNLNQATHIRDFSYSDTLMFPIVCIDFDERLLINTKHNWFDNFSQYLPIGWEYKTFGYMEGDTNENK